MNLFNNYLEKIVISFNFLLAVLYSDTLYDYRSTGETIKKISSKRISTDSDDNFVQGTLIFNFPMDE